MANTVRPGDRSLDMVSLKALAHPLRVSIIDTLSIFGQSTASGLAERLGESSGATSYHLRQLEKHGFVREVVGKGTARERWWERVPGGLALRPDNFEEPAAARDASTLVTRQWATSSSSRLLTFLEHSDDISAEWMDAVSLTTANLRLTHEQLAEIVEQFTEHLLPLIDRLRDEEQPEARPVQIHFNAFPVIDGTENAPLNSSENP